MTLGLAGSPPRPAIRRRKLASVLAWLRLCLARWRERIELGELGEDRLRDVGLTRSQAAREAARQPWHGLDRC